MAWMFGTKSRSGDAQRPSQDNSNNNTLREQSNEPTNPTAHHFNESTRLSSSIAEEPVTDNASHYGPVPPRSNVRPLVTQQPQQMQPGPLRPQGPFPPHAQQQYQQHPSSLYPGPAQAQHAPQNGAPGPALGWGLAPGFTQQPQQPQPQPQQPQQPLQPLQPPSPHPASTTDADQDHLGDHSQPASPMQDEDSELPSPLINRIPSFEGLPPIRTNSVFKLGNTATEWDLGDFSFEDTAIGKKDDGPSDMFAAVNAAPTPDPAPAASPAPATVPAPTSVPEPEPNRPSEESFDESDPNFPPPENATTKSYGLDSNATLVGGDTNRTTRTSLMGKEPSRFSNPPPVPTDNPLAQMLQQQQQQQQQQSASNPVQRQPPSGWHLEESHLTAPLHQARRRPDIESAPQQPDTYLDKETGAAANPTSGSRAQHSEDVAESLDSDSDDEIPIGHGQPISDPAQGTTALGMPGQQQPTQQPSSPPLGTFVSSDGANSTPNLAQGWGGTASQEFIVTADNQLEKKKTLLPGGLSRPSTAGQANDASSITESTANKPRKFFGGIGAKFNRATPDAPQKPASAYSNRSSMSGAPGGAPGGLFDRSFFGRGRSGTADSVGSFGIAPPPSSQPQDAEGRDKGGSVANKFTSMFKGKSESDPRTQGEVGPGSIEPGRASVDGRRSTRHLSQGSIQAPRPSPLGQEFNVEGGTTAPPQPQNEQGQGPRTAAPDVPTEHMVNNGSAVTKPLPGVPGAPFDPRQHQSVNGQVLGGETRSSKTPAMVSTEQSSVPVANQHSAPVNRPLRPTLTAVDSTSHLSSTSRDSPSSQMPPPVTGWRPTQNAEDEQQQQQQQQTDTPPVEQPKAGGRFRLPGKSSQAPTGGQKSKWKGWKEKLVGRASHGAQEKNEQGDGDIWKHRMSNHGAQNQGQNQQAPQGFAPQQPGQYPVHQQQVNGQNQWVYQQQMSPHPQAPGQGQIDPRFTQGQFPQGQFTTGQVPVQGGGRGMAPGFHPGQPMPRGFPPGQNQFGQQQQQQFVPQQQPQPQPPMVQQPPPSPQPQLQIQPQPQPQPQQPPTPSAPIQSSPLPQTSQQPFTAPDRPLSNAPTTPASTDDLVLPIQRNDADEVQEDTEVTDRQPTVVPTLARGNTAASSFSTESGAIGIHGQQIAPVPRQQQQIQPQISRASMNTVDMQSENGGALKVRESTHSGSPSLAKPSSIFSNHTGAESKGVSRHVSVSQQEQQQHSKPSSVDASHETTPRLKQDATGSSHNASMISKSNTGSSLTSVGDGSKPTDVHMELEDTNAARMRTMRMDGQEEKIFYEPEPEMPKMTATSYPGQEWNPYGEPEFMNWQDD